MAAATVTSNPPVASTTTRRGVIAPRRSVSSAKPLPSRATAKASPFGRTWTSNRSFATSIPTKNSSILSRPCICGLALRPERLFGFDGTTDGAPCSVTASMDRDTIGLPSAPAEPMLARLRLFDIQDTEDTERHGVHLEDQTFEAVFEGERVEIHEQTDLVPAQPQIGEHLRLVDRHQPIH